MTLPITRYTVVNADKDDFAALVNEHLRGGWVPYGSPTFDMWVEVNTRGEHVRRIDCYQAMTYTEYASAAACT